MQTATHHPSSGITKIFWLAAAFNLGGVLLFSRMFTNELLSSLNPVVFSHFGLVGILLWGLAYLSVSTTYHQVPHLLLVFFVEKMIYTYTWLAWLSRHGQELPGLFSTSPMTATFYSIYGPGDFLSGLFFLWVAAKILRAPRVAAA